MSLDFNNREYERHEKHNTESWEREAEEAATRIYKKALDFRGEVIETINRYLPHLQPFDLCELNNLAEQLDNAISIEARENLRGTK